jgi:hypothetical protein
MLSLIIPLRAPLACPALFGLLKQPKYPKGPETITVSLQGSICVHPKQQELAAQTRCYWIANRA